MASSLEKRWNGALVHLEELRAQFAEFQRKEGFTVTPEQRARVIALAEDLPRLWNAPSTNAKDKKRILRLLIKDIAVERIEGRKQALLRVRWQGGTNEEIQIAIPPHIADRLRYPEEVVERVRDLARHQADGQIAETLNQEGRRSAQSKAFNASIVKWLRFKHRIHLPELKRPDELTVDQVAAKFEVSRGVVYYWIERGVIGARRRNRSSPYWITLEPEKEKVLQEWVRESTRIPKTRKESEAAR